MIKFFVAFTLLLFAIIALSFTALSVAKGLPIAALLLSQGICLLGCYALLGIGIGLPIVILAGAASWWHLWLLYTGEVKPHLPNQTFFDVLKTMFRKI